MADDLGAWDDEDYAPPDVKVTGAYGEEVVRKLAEDEAKKSDALAQAASQQPSKDKSKKQQKAKEKSPNNNAVEVPEAKQLTPQELENLQRAADLAAAAETFGLRDSSAECSIDRFEPTSKEDFDNLVNLLSTKLASYHKSDHYTEFLSNLFTELCIKLDSKHILRFGKELTALASEKLKEEKEKERAKQPKAKKKPKLVKEAKSGDLDDVVGDATGGGYDYDDDDFM